ncbi:hydrogenase nickel incorporation protein HypB [Vibrio sp. MA40-2]|uniref:hydrogenase nickel incorporation protein HypB n=1 Tax=Vibrio sp. MA40-2 TaxID=3391828 RepID=UPI0039A49B81
MCTTCGCGAGNVTIENTQGYSHQHDNNSEHPHQHEHNHLPPHSHQHKTEAQVVHHHYFGPVHIHYHATADIDRSSTNIPNTETSHQHAHDHKHSHHKPSHHKPSHHHQEEIQDVFYAQKNGDDLHFGKGAAHSHAPGMTQSRMVQIETDILAKNDAIAHHNRDFLNTQNIKALNLVSSPGSGKTTLLVETLKRLDTDKCAVIEGDQQTSNDADRIRQTGVKAIQINTGKGCHLDAQMVSQAIDHLKPQPDNLLFIENVGNLVCPAAFDLGEHFKVAVLSVTEGEDKPLKYPDIFSNADLMLINKTDLLPHLNFDLETCIAHAKRINPDLQIMLISATTGEGMQAWLDWLQEK